MYKVWRWYEGEIENAHYTTSKTYKDAEKTARLLIEQGASVEIENEKGDIVFYHY